MQRNVSYFDIKIICNKLIGFATTFLTKQQKFTTSLKIALYSQFKCPYTVCVLQVGQEIEVRPGIVSKDADGKLTCKPIFSRIVSLFAENNDLQYAVPGGLIGNIF